MISDVLYEAAVLKFNSTDYISLLSESQDILSKRALIEMFLLSENTTPLAVEVKNDLQAIGDIRSLKQRDRAVKNTLTRFLTKFLDTEKIKQEISKQEVRNIIEEARNKNYSNILTKSNSLVKAYLKAYKPYKFTFNFLETFYRAGLTVEAILNDKDVVKFHKILRSVEFGGAIIFTSHLLAKSIIAAIVQGSLASFLLIIISCCLTVIAYRIALTIITICTKMVEIPIALFYTIINKIRNRVKKTKQ